MLRRAFPSFALVLLVAALGLAQTTGGIQGWIVDSSNAPLPGVTVEASGASLQGKRTITSGRDGTYRLPALPPGLYKLSASLPGFASVEKTVDVALDAATTVKLILQLSLKEQVLVTAEAPFVDTSATTTGTTYRCGVIVHLPVDRNYADVVKGNPGVVTDNGRTQGRGLALAIGGATSAENGWIVDGINTVNVLKGTQGKAINTEFIQEIEVKTGGFQAEYGRALGGVINVITKSGGNAFHGDVFLYYDSASLQARRVFVEGVDSPRSGMRLDDFQRTDYGVDLGGPLVADRLWFFAAYNRVDFPARVSRFVASELVPTTMQFPLDGTDNLYSAKLTWSPAPGSTLVGTVFADPTTNSGSGAADPRQGSAILQPVKNPDPATWEASRTIGGTDFGLRAGQVFGSSGFATLQAARHQDSYVLAPTGPGRQVQIRDFTCTGGTPDSPCQPPPDANSVEGGFGPMQGFGFGPSNIDASRRDQVRGDANLYLGPHDIKLGADYQDAKTVATTSFSGGQLVTRFNDYGQTYYEHDFFARSPEDLRPVDEAFIASAREAGVYVQDSWKVGPGLTVNAGLRWDVESFRDDQSVTRIRLANEWQPRLGVVWDPLRNGSTKVYAFAGRFHYSLPLEMAARTFSSNTFVATYNTDPADVTHDPNVPGHEGKPQILGGALPEPVDSGLKGTWLDEYTLGVERLFGSSLSVGLRATYRGLGGAIEDRCDLDGSSTETNMNTCGMVQTGSGGRIARGDIPGCNGLDEPAFQCSDTIPAVPRAKRIYRGVELLARKSLSERLWVQASYVFSSLRGNYDGAVNEGNGGQTSPGINEDFDYAAVARNNNYGRLYLDRPHSFRLDGFVMTPFHLSIGLQVYARSGAPLNKLGYFNSFYFVQLVPRGSASRLPTEWDGNLTLEYPIRVGPANVALQAYLYNVFNNQIRTNQDTQWSVNRPPDYPASLYDPNQEKNNPNYGLITSRQDGRLFRAAIRVSF